MEHLKKLIVSLQESFMVEVKGMISTSIKSEMGQFFQPNRQNQNNNRAIQNKNWGNSSGANINNKN